MAPTHCSFEMAGSENSSDQQVVAENPSHPEPNEPTSCVPEPKQAASNNYRQNQPALINSEPCQTAPTTFEQNQPASNIPVPTDPSLMQPLVVRTGTPTQQPQLPPQYMYGGYYCDQNGMWYSYVPSSNSSPATTASSTPIHFQDAPEGPMSSESGTSVNQAQYSMPYVIPTAYYATPPMGSPQLIYPQAAPYGSPLAQGATQFIPVGQNAPQYGFQAPPPAAQPIAGQYVSQAQTVSQYVPQAQTPPQYVPQAQTPPQYVSPAQTPPQLGPHHHHQQQQQQSHPVNNGAMTFYAAPPTSAALPQEVSAIPALPQIERLNLNNVPMYRPSSNCNLKKQPSNMAEIWHSEFAAKFQQFSGSWELVPAPHGYEAEADGIFEDTAKIRFVCKNCLHAWTSMQGKVKFWYKFEPMTQQGQVHFQLFGQKCKQCKEKHGSDDMQDALWYPDEISKVVHNIHSKVGMVYYNIQSPVIMIQRRIGRPKGQHNADLCAACQKGICRRNGPKANLQY